MYNAHIVYKFKEGQVEEGVKIWEEGVFNKISKAQGFVRVQLYTSGDEMMAIGSWEDKSYAEAFMRTGVFKDILTSFGDLLIEQPVTKSLDMRYFESV